MREAGLRSGPATVLVCLLAALTGGSGGASAYAAEPLSGPALNRAVESRLSATRGQHPPAERPAEGSASAHRTTGVKAETGDLIVYGGQRYRLWGVAAPRLNEFGGLTSLRGLIGLIEGAATICTPAGMAVGGVPVARCRTGGKDLGALLVGRGFARDCPRQSRGTYAAAERRAIVDVAGGFELPDECRTD